MPVGVGKTCRGQKGTWGKSMKKKKESRLGRGEIPDFQILLALI